MFRLFFEWYSSKSPSSCPIAVHFLCNNTVKKSTVLSSLRKCFSYNHCCDVISFRDSDCATSLCLLTSSWLAVVDVVTFCWWCHNQCHCWRAGLADLWHRGIVEDRADSSNSFVHCDVIIASLNWTCSGTLGSIFNFIVIIIIHLINNIILQHIILIIKIH